MMMILEEEGIGMEGIDPKINDSQRLKSKK
jgi:hypothetical protein